MNKIIYYNRYNILKPLLKAFSIVFTAFIIRMQYSSFNKNMKKSYFPKKKKMFSLVVLPKEVRIYYIILRTI